MKDSHERGGRKYDERKKGGGRNLTTTRRLRGEWRKEYDERGRWENDEREKIKEKNRAAHGEGRKGMTKEGGEMMKGKNKPEANPKA